MGQSWYNDNFELINFTYLTLLALLAVYLVASTVLAVPLYLSIAQTIVFYFNTVVLGFVASDGDGRSREKLHLTELDQKKLSVSQRKVAEILLLGHEYKEVAVAMGLSLSAVKRRVHAICKIYGVQNRTEFFLATKAFFIKSF